MKSLLSGMELSQVRETESADGDHQDGEQHDDASVDAPRLVPLQLQEDLEDWVDQEPFFSVRYFIIFIFP